MTKKSVVYAGINANLKGSTEGMLSDSGITSASDISLDLFLSVSKPAAVGSMTREQLDAELQKGVDSINAGKVYSADEVDAVLAKEFGIS